jgi:Domain of unknown function (DUF4173)
MNKELLNTVLVLLGATLYTIIFWGEKMGLNVVVYASFLIGSLYLLDKDVFRDRAVQVAAGGAMLSAVLVFTHNSMLVKLVHFLCIGVLTGLTQYRTLRFIGYALLLYIGNLFEAPIRSIQEIIKLPRLGRSGTPSKFGFSSLWLSMLIVPVFYFIYYIANPEFASMSDIFWGKVISLLSFDWNFGKIFFFITGLMITGATLWKHSWINFDYYTTFQEDLDEEKVSKKGVDVEKKYKESLVLLATLNVLLFFNNMIDLGSVWGKINVVRTPLELKQYVHAGTYILIVGIILAIIVVSIIFKGYLNFYAKNKLLKTFAYIWIGQNAFLALSVACRNWQYIAQCGLAYKRIGVVIFLLLVLIGLLYITFKIRDQRSIYYVVVRMGWTVYMVLLASCFVPWDSFITRYNISAYAKNKTIDLPFLINEVSDKNISILLENKDFLKGINQAIPQPNNDEGTSSINVENAIQNKINMFRSSQAELGVWSWNLADHGTWSAVK